MKPTAVDLFSGSGMFSLAAEAAGFNVLAHCECDPFAVTLLAHRFPKTPIFTDVRKITKDTFYEYVGHRTVDVVCGGSPCQDLSVAGKQRGLAGERSGLFYEQMRIARELSAKYVVWENVPGALSSNRGRDFAAILGEFTGRDVGDFLDGSGAVRWGNAGAFRARTECDFSVVYRILDTRFFGIPQRRRRIYLVARLGTECRPEILFEPYGVRRHYEASGEAREEVATLTAKGFGNYDTSSIAAPINTKIGRHLASGETFVVFENHGQDSRVKEVDIIPTISSKAGTGGGNLPLVCFSQNQVGEVRASDVAPTLNTNSNPSGRNVALCIPIDMRNSVRNGEGKQGLGIGNPGDPAFTSTTAAPHAVASPSGIRRLTPVECERLQGMPDNWTKVPYRGKTADKCPDSPRYKVCGNAVTKDVAEFVCVGVYEDFMKEVR